MLNEKEARVLTLSERIWDQRNPNRDHDDLLANDLAHCAQQINNHARMKYQRVMTSLKFPNGMPISPVFSSDEIKTGSKASVDAMLTVLNGQGDGFTNISTIRTRKGNEVVDLYPLNQELTLVARHSYVTELPDQVPTKAVYQFEILVNPNEATQKIIAAERPHFEAMERLKETLSGESVYLRAVMNDPNVSEQVRDVNLPGIDPSIKERDLSAIKAMQREIDYISGGKLDSVEVEGLSVVNGVNTLKLRIVESQRRFETRREERSNQLHAAAFSELERLFNDADGGKEIDLIDILDANLSAPNRELDNGIPVAFTPAMIEAQMKALIPELVQIDNWGAEYDGLFIKKSEEAVAEFKFAGKTVKMYCKTERWSDNGIMQYNVTMRKIH